MVEYDYTSVQSQAMYKEETTWGTAVTADSYFGRLKSYSFTYGNGITEDYDLGRREAKNLLYGAFTVTGNIDFDLIGGASTGTNNIFKLIMGSVSGDGGSGTEWKYPSGTTTYTAGINTLPLVSASIELGKNSTTDSNWIIDGCVCNSATISFSKEGTIGVSTKWTGRKSIIESTIVTYVAPTTAPYTFVQATFLRDNTNVGVVDSGSITVENNLIESRGIGSRLLQGLYAGQSKITYELSVVLNTLLLTTMLADAYGDAVGSGPELVDGVVTTHSYELQVTDGANRTIVFDLTKAVINEHTEGIEVGNNLCMIKFSGISSEFQITEQDSA